MKLPSAYRFIPCQPWFALGSKLVFITALAWGASAQAQTTSPPEASSGFTPKPGWTFSQRGVSSANPLASAAGLKILQQGGSAVDAAIAVQMVLTLVEPQSSGIGGGAFMVHHDGQQTQVWDGRETAPVLAPEDLFTLHGKALPFQEVVAGGRPVGVPGVLRMLSMAHQQHGQLPWASLFAPAIELAEKGFEISPRLHALLKTEPSLLKDPQAAAYFFYPNGQPYPVGHRLTNPGLAQVLRLIALKGADAFYSGPLAQRMVDKVQWHPNNPGLLTMADLAKYRPIVREPLCFTPPSAVNPTALKVCGVGPPSSGLLAMGQIMGMLANTQAANHSIDSVDWQHHYHEASRLALADRALYVADPDFVQAPAGDWQSLWHAPYLKQRASLIQAQRMPLAPPGQPGGAAAHWAPMPEQMEQGTSHLSVVDGQGHTVSMTTSIESAFGAKIMVSMGPRGGFLLNNQLTDFSFEPRDASGQPVANRLQAGKRPRSSMNPLLVLSPQTQNDGKGSVQIAMGSPGGAMIIHYTTQSLWAMLQTNMDAQAAFHRPHSGVTQAQGPLLVEKNLFSPSLIEGLRARGHDVLSVDMPSGLQALQRKDTQWLGAADPRREGQVSGE